MPEIKAQAIFPQMERRQIYQNPLASESDIADFRLEGPARITFPEGRMRMESAADQSLGQKANYVLWCGGLFPADIEIRWKFRPLREPGLAMIFFAAAGRGGEDILAPSLRPRRGEYDSYHHGDINAYHISYFRRKWEEERSFHTCNMRKSYGFHLVCQGADPIPSAEDVSRPYAMSIVKLGNEIVFQIDGLSIFHYTDGRVDGEDSPALGGGRIGLRQMAPLCAEYADLEAFRLVPRGGEGGRG